MERDVVKYSPKYISQPQFLIQSHRDQDKTRTSVVCDQMPKISSPKSITNRKKDIIVGIESKFVCYFTSLDYYEPMKIGRWKNIPILMCLKILKKITYDHLNMQSHM